jgi:hypothetical protein
MDFQTLDAFCEKITQLGGCWWRTTRRLWLASFTAAATSRIST